MTEPEHPAFRALSRIVLTGFMGAGKSTVGPILSSSLGWQFLDVDHQLQLKAGVTIAELFSIHGEPAFRQMEADLFASLHQQSGVVIALGGGGLESPSTRSMIEQAQDTCMVLLQAPLDLLVERCETQPGAAVRPILRERESLRQRFAARQRYYHQARIQIETSELKPGDVAERILDELHKKGFLGSSISRSPKVMAD